MGRFCCRSPSKIIGLTVYEMARRRAIVSALQQKRVGENNQELVDEREEREETNRRRRLQREKTRRREEKGEKARQRGNNEEAASARREEEIEVEEGGCSHCRASVATECVYLCQKGHLHRDLPGEGCHHCGRRGESECKSAFMRILRAGGGLVDRGGQQAGKGSSRATSAANISS